MLGSAADVDVEDLEDLRLLTDVGLIITVDDDDIGTAFAEVDRRGESRDPEPGDEDPQAGQRRVRSGQRGRDLPDSHGVGGLCSGPVVCGRVLLISQREPPSRRRRGRFRR